MRKSSTTVKSNVVSASKIKVTIHIPENVPRRQEKINRIYDILNPESPIANPYNLRTSSNSLQVTGKN